MSRHDDNRLVDTSHAIVQVMVDHDLVALEAAVARIRGLT